MIKVFDGIYANQRKFFTKALISGKVYGERTIKENGKEYREWNPFKSKYCAALTKGLRENIFKPGETVLYLGSAEGTSVSHVSDIIGNEGIIFCVDLSGIAMQQLNKLAEKRENLFPILSDANKIEQYKDDVGNVDVIFQDISQRNQTEIFLKNSQLLKKGGLGALSLKTKSISQDKKETTLETEKKKLEDIFQVLQVVPLDPYEKEHYLILVRKK